MTKRIYAVAETVPPNKQRYLIPGKWYPLVPSERFDVGESGEVLGGFSIIDDEGDDIFCLWSACGHLEGGNWTRIEEESDDA